MPTPDPVPNPDLDELAAQFKALFENVKNNEDQLAEINRQLGRLYVILREIGAKFDQV